MFGSFKEYVPPKVDNPYFNGGSFGVPSPNQLFFIPPSFPDGFGDQKRFHEQAPSPIHDVSPNGKENFFQPPDHILRETDSINKVKVPGRVSRQHFQVRNDDSVCAPVDNSQLTASLIAENASLREKVSVYEDKLRQVDSMFSMMMSRISALEQNGSVRSVPPPRQSKDVSPKSPLPSSRSARTAASSQIPSSRTRSISNSRSRPNLTAPTTSSRNRSITPTNRSVAVAARERVGSMSTVGGPVNRSKSPARVTRPPAVTSAPKPVNLSSASSARPSSPVIRYEVHISYNERIVAKAQLTPSISQDGPFLYVIQSDLKPPLSFVPASSTGCAFTGLSISVVGTNTRTRKNNVVFKSHSSHVENPPVNDADGYFSHSCWLSGPDASVVGGVRVFFRPTDESNESITVYAMSLKFWFPESQESSNFTKEHWRELLKLLGLL